MTKKRINVESDNIRWDIDGCSLGTLAEKFKDLAEEWGADAIFRVDSYSEYGDPCAALKISSTRWETDEECASRMLREEAYRKRIDDNERAELERLKAKFGGTQ